jgi:CRISPR-associated protein Csm3
MNKRLKQVTLHGRIILSGEIHAASGIRIGGRPTGVEIGGVDNIVLRNPVDGRPYIPGSSLKGKMRSLYERAQGAVQNTDIGEYVMIHSCKKDPIAYETCPICHIYGLPGEGEAKADSPTPLIVRDVPLDLATVQGASNYTEVKWEAAIDRVTSAANPRQMERVPAGAVFKPLGLVFNIYTQADLARWPHVVTALQLLEDDYLGGLGSRGSGQVNFKRLEVTCKALDGARERYVTTGTKTFDDLAGLVTALADTSSAGLMAWLTDKIPIRPVAAPLESEQLDSEIGVAGDEEG